MCTFSSVRNLTPNTVGVQRCKSALAQPSPLPQPPQLCQVRPGVLPRMLREILDTRVMIKGAMKKVAAADKVRHAAMAPCGVACGGTDQMVARDLRSELPLCAGDCRAMLTTEVMPPP